MSLAARWMLATMCVPLAGCALTSVRTAEQPTTGDKLRAIHEAAHGSGAWIQPGFTEREVAARLANAPRWCADLRTRLLSNPPSMYAEVDTDRTADDPPLTPASYPIDAPGLYPSAARERADLVRAHAAGLVGDDELAELLAIIDVQARRPAFRRASERAPAHDATRARDEWLRAWLEAYANVERVPGAELPCADPNPPAERSTRAWRRPDFWVDPQAATTR